tara:strand:+ start:10402 stop:10809 length:408 start_codon:yes stop_codon:yes gene_type:complete
MSEANLSRNVMKILRPLDAQRVENKCGKGTPDVNYIGGWIELKQQDAWPKRPTTKVRLSHDLTLEQRIWINRREKKGGTVFVLLQIARDYLLLSGGVAATVIGEANEAELRSAALHVWTASEMKDQLLPCLRPEN